MTKCALIKNNIVTNIIAINEDVIVIIPDDSQITSEYIYDPVLKTFTAPDPA
jgi:hypothetical protein